MNLDNERRAIVNYFKPIKGFMPLVVRFNPDNPSMLTIEGQMSAETYKKILNDYECKMEKSSGTHEHNTPLLWDANPNCIHEIVNAPGGGIKCNKCDGWFCH